MRNLFVACWLVLTLASPAHATGCVVENAALKCEGTAADALASETTRALFLNPLDKLSLYEDRAAAERFRVSLEDIWRKANQDAKRLEFRLRRGRVSGSDFEAFVKVFAKAEENYELGIDLYRNLVWQGRFDPTPGL